MNKGFLYYLGKFLNFLQSKFPKQYNNFQGTGILRLVLNGIISNYKDSAKNTVTEVKGKHKDKEAIEPIIVKE